MLGAGVMKPEDAFARTCPRSQTTVPWFGGLGHVLAQMAVCGRVFPRLEPGGNTTHTLFTLAPNAASWYITRLRQH